MGTSLAVETGDWNQWADQFTTDARYLEHHAIPAQQVEKVGMDDLDTKTLIESGRVQLLINTPRGGRARTDGRVLRHAAKSVGIPCVTTLAGALSVARSLRAGETALNTPKSLQDWHA